MLIKEKDEVDFHEIKIGGSLVSECELVYSCFSEVYRLYIKRDEANGFKAVAIYNPHSDNTKECWENNENNSLIIDIIFCASACFDGTRELEFNHCVHHPCLDRIGSLIKALRKVEIDICPDANESVTEE
jgi:hypothetical protein